MTKSTTDSHDRDTELVAQLLAGNEAAARELVRRHAAPLTRFLNAAGASEGDVEDLVQETLVRAFRKAGSWRRESSYRAWLFAISRNLLRDAIRRRRVMLPLSVVIDVAAAPDMTDSRVETEDLLDGLRKGLLRLTPMQREVFLLRAQQGLSYGDVAIAAGTTEQAARVHYHHAVRRLKEMIR